jgi:hypothetical protein
MVQTVKLSDVEEFCAHLGFVHRAGMRLEAYHAI